MQTQSVRAAGDLPSVFLVQISLKGACKGNVQPQARLASFIAAFIGPKDERVGILGLFHGLKHDVRCREPEQRELGRQAARLRGDKGGLRRIVERIGVLTDAAVRQVSAVRIERVGKAVLPDVRIFIGIGAAFQKRQIQTAARSVVAVFAVGQEPPSERSAYL